jgi:hypothetical protein
MDESDLELQSVLYPFAKMSIEKTLVSIAQIGLEWMVPS